MVIISNAQKNTIGTTVSAQPGAINVSIMINNIATYIKKLDI